MRRIITPIYFASLLIVLAGCAPKTSSFLAGCPPVQRGEIQKGYYSSAALTPARIARIYVDPIDVSRIADQPRWQELVAEELQKSIATEIKSSTGYGLADSVKMSTARLQVAVIHLDAGSRAGRALVGAGVGDAEVEIEGKLVDPANSQLLVCFVDASTDSGGNGNFDLSHDASKELLEYICDRLASRIPQSISNDLKYRKQPPR